MNVLEGNSLPGRLAIVSTFDDLCGIAGVTKALVPHLEKRVGKVQVFDLDQYLLRGTSRRLDRMGDESVRAIADELRGFDSVNIQLEHGTLGKTVPQILRRFRMLAEAAPALSVTFHTIHEDDGAKWAEILEAASAGSFLKVARMMSGDRRSTKLGGGIYKTLKQESRRKPVHCIVHNRKDARLLSTVRSLPNVHHHPLSYISAEQAEAHRSAASRGSFPGLSRVPSGAKLIGTFGFLSRYKGFETAIRALKHLPDDYHLAIFGGVHPQAIQRDTGIDKYVQSLLDETNVGRTVFDGLAAGRDTKDCGLRVQVALDPSTTHLLTEHPGDVSRRVHFVGVLPDDEFYGAMSVCDSVVFPYLEVGQSSSGPISMAMEMSSRIIASRTKTFLQYARYHPGEIEFFDIGNHVELASRVAEPGRPRSRDRKPTFNIATNIETYLAANPALNATLPATT